MFSLPQNWLRQRTNSSPASTARQFSCVNCTPIQLRQRTTSVYSAPTSKLNSENLKTTTTNSVSTFSFHSLPPWPTPASPPTISSLPPPHTSTSAFSCCSNAKKKDMGKHWFQRRESMLAATCHVASLTFHFSLSPHLSTRCSGGMTASLREEYPGRQGPCHCVWTRPRELWYTRTRAMAPRGWMRKGRLGVQPIGGHFSRRNRVRVHAV